MKKREQFTSRQWQESMITALQSGRRGYQEDVHGGLQGNSRLGARVLWIVMYLLVAIVLSRIVYLQVFEKGQHELISANNHLEKVREEARRGRILDRNGEVIVDNVPQGEGYLRRYILGEAAAGITGYVSEVREEELGCSEGICYYLGSKIGRTGIEKSMESVLKGNDGGRLVEKNAVGEEVRELGINQAEAGEDLSLSVDANLQKIMHQALGAQKGSAVAVDMQGKVLGLVTSPSYNPNLFTVEADEKLLKTMLADEENLYFLDRAISGIYPPGSVFKMVTAYAGLESGKIGRDTLIEDTGEIKIDQYRYGNWYFDQYGAKEGEINVERALARSNDIFFYKVGEMVGVDKIEEYARVLGFGEVTGVELPGEEEGLVPSRLWKERATGEKWFLGNTYHLSIGQGDLQVTPAQVARMTAAAVSGRLCRFSLLKESKPDCKELGLAEENILAIREGMKGACLEGGTAFPFFDFSPWVLCKTGTAQHAGQVINSEMSTNLEVPPHAWVTVAYPGNNPQMVLTVMLEAAGEGSGVAGPVAKEILKKWQELGN